MCYRLLGGDGGDGGDGDSGGGDSGVCTRCIAIDRYRIERSVSFKRANVAKEIERHAFVYRGIVCKMTHMIDSRRYNRQIGGTWSTSCRVGVDQLADPDAIDTQLYSRYAETPSGYVFGNTYYPGRSESSAGAFINENDRFRTREGISYKSQQYALAHLLDLADDIAKNMI